MASSLEIENAKKCDDIQSCSRVVAVKLKDSILLVGWKTPNYPFELTRQRIVHKLGDSILVSACGFGTDSHHVVRKAQTELVTHILSTDLPPQTEQIVSKISEYLHMFASKPEYRPLGVATIVAGANVNKTLSLFKIAADGERYEYNACCIGRDASKMMRELERCYDVNHSPGMALKSILLLLNENDPSNVQVGVVKIEGQASLLTESEIKELLESTL